MLPDPKGDPRPKDIVAWVEEGVARLRLQDEDQRIREADRRLFLEAKAAVDRAQSEHNARERQRINEAWEPASPQAKADTSGTRCQPKPFDRHGFLRSEHLLEAYGYVQPGMAIQTQGGREREVVQVPRSDLEPASTPA